MPETEKAGDGLMDVDSKEFKDIEASLSGAKDDAKSPPPENAASQAEAPSLAAKVAALEKELARVRGVKRDEHDEEVVKLRERLAKMEGRLEGKAGAQKTIAEYAGKDLLAFKHQWDDAMESAREAGDGEKVKLAKSNIRLIEQELLERGSPKAQEDDHADETRKELSALYEETLKDVPDLNDKDSDLWKACKEWYDSHPALMKRLGPMGDMMAVAKVVMKRPDLLKGVAKAARKDILSNIEKATDKAIKTGGGSPEIKHVPDFAEMTSEEFEKIERRILSGLPLTG